MTILEKENEYDIEGVEDAYEDAYDIALAESVLEEMKETGEEPQPIEKLWERLGL